MKMRLATLTVCILGIVLFVVAGISLAEEIITQHSIWWTDSAWQKAWLQLESDDPITASFTGTLQVRHAVSGEVVFSKDLDTSCVPRYDEPGLGRCGTLEHTINSDDFERQDFEVWRRACWMVTGYTEPLCTVYVPDNCNLAGAGCTMILSATKVTVPTLCRTTIEACGTVQDDQGFWLITTFRGTKPYKIWLPMLAIEKE